MVTTLTDQNSTQLYTFTSVGAVGTAGDGRGLRTTPARSRRRKAGRKSRQGRDAVAWLWAAPRRCSRETIGPRDRDTVAIVDPVWMLS